MEVVGLRLLEVPLFLGDPAELMVGSGVSVAVVYAITQVLHLVFGLFFALPTLGRVFGLAAAFFALAARFFGVVLRLFAGRLAATRAVGFGTRTFAGSPTTSAVVRPDGTLLSYQPYGKDGLLIAEIDIAAATGLLAARYKSG